MMAQMKASSPRAKRWFRITRLYSCALELPDPWTDTLSDGRSRLASLTDEFMHGRSPLRAYSAGLL
jgi:hypothetical protein